MRPHSHTSMRTRTPFRTTVMSLSLVQLSNRYLTPEIRLEENHEQGIHWLFARVLRARPADRRAKRLRPRPTIASFAVSSTRCIAMRTRISSRIRPRTRSAGRTRARWCSLTHRSKTLPSMRLHSSPSSIISGNARPSAWCTSPFSRTPPKSKRCARGGFTSADFRPDQPVSR